MNHAYWGEEYTDADIENFLSYNNISYELMENDNLLTDRVVQYLEQGKIVGWFQGRFEWGPRALGNRSILADPRNPEQKDIINMKIKYREPFRPFAPVVLEEMVEDFFEIKAPQVHFPLRFMLLTVPAHESNMDKIPAVTHVDKTARLQTIREEWNPRYYKLIKKFGDATGVPVLLNTSFNLKGKPIVNTPEDAFLTFKRSGIDILIMEKFILKKDANI